MILQNPEFLLLLPAVLLAARHVIGNDSYSRKIGLSRILLILLLVGAAASPSLTQEESVPEEQKLNVLVDNTTSTQVLQSQDVASEYTSEVFASGNSSEIMSLASNTIEEESHNLLVTDAQTDESVDGIVEAAEEKNATISVYRSESREETAVSIEGPSTTVPEANNEFTVKVSSTREEPVQANITLDNELVYSGSINGSYSFQRSFESEGEHTLQAHISSDDVFTENNHYYETVNVREKPEILSIGESGTLEEELDSFYEVENRENLPQDLENYYSILLKKPVNDRRLEEYIAGGNGAVYTGSMDEELPDYLPVRKTGEQESEAGARIVILIDNSASTGSCQDGVEEDTCFDAGGQGTVSKESLKIAYSLVDTLDQNNEVGVVAYNTESFLVSRPKSLTFNREEIKSKIARITPQGNSFHNKGLEGAGTLTEDNDTVVMLSDGKISNYAESERVPSKTRNLASGMNSKLITVGMGEDPNRPFLENIAETTSGYYLENDETGRLKFRFGSGGGESEYTPIRIVNPNHFITDGLELESTTTGFKSVETQPSAKKLVTGSNGKNFLSTWRYGLGRVAAFSAGQENLERTVNSDPEIVSRTVSWSVGDPQRKEDNWTKLEDTSRPENPTFQASYNREGLERRSENVYSTELPKPGLGLHEWRGENYAYNYHPEKKQVGLDEDKLQSIAQETGGRVFNSDNINEIEQEIGETDRTVERQTSLSPYLLILAIVVFLGEVGYRKLNGRL